MRQTTEIRVKSAAVLFTTSPLSTSILTDFVVQLKLLEHATSGVVPIRVDYIGGVHSEGTIFDEASEDTPIRKGSG